MGKASRETASETVRLQGFEGHFEHLEGGYSVAFERFTEDLDLTPYYEGLPDGRCPVEHWGYVLKGKLTYRYEDREETYEAGDAFFGPPGHTPVIHAGTEVVEFSLTEANQAMLEVVRSNMEAAGRL
jgi:hypothetical protein